MFLVGAMMSNRFPSRFRFYVITYPEEERHYVPPSSYFFFYKNYSNKKYNLKKKKVSEKHSFAKLVD